MEAKHFKADAKQMVDMLFDKGLLTKEVTRDDMNALEDLIEFILSSRFDSYLRLEKLTNNLKK